jgi:pyridoxine 4-dehydrogenase
MTWNSQPPSEEVCFETLNTAFKLGANLWNGGEIYGTPERNSLHLLHNYFTKFPEKADQVVLSIKGGALPGVLQPDGSEANLRRSVNECLRVLDGKKSVDIFECARQDPNTTIEQTVTILAQLVKEGKIGGIGLSEVDADTIRRAYVQHRKDRKVDQAEVLNIFPGTKSIQLPRWKLSFPCGRQTFFETILLEPVLNLISQWWGTLHLVEEH